MSDNGARELAEWLELGMCPACHHADHDPGSCPECPNCELHFNDAIEWLRRNGQDKAAMWREMFAAVGEQWAAVLDRLDLAEDASAEDVLRAAALSARGWHLARSEPVRRGRLRICVPEDHAPDGTVARWTAEADIRAGQPYTYSTIGIAVWLDWLSE